MTVADIKNTETLDGVAPLADTIRRACERLKPERMRADLEAFARRVKLSGTPEELESFRYLEGRLAGMGYECRLILHDAYISLPGPARLRVADLEPVCITHSFGCPAQGLQAVIVDVGAGTDEDFAAVDLTDKIALIDGIASPQLTDRANRAGAIGQIHVSPHEYRHEMCVSPVWGNPDPGKLERLPKTAVVTVSAEDGAHIRTTLQQYSGLTAVMDAEVDTRWRKTPLLTAEFMPEGASSDCPFVLFSGHHDTWFHGVMDNGSANATMLAVAEALLGEASSWKRGLRLAFWSGHSHGRYSGSAWYADTHFRELAARCVAHVNVDSTGGIGATVLADTPASSELRALADEAVAAQSGQRVWGARMMRVGDQSFWGIGVPSIFTGMSEQPSAGVNDGAASYAAGAEPRQGAGFGWWWHTEFDTIDKIDMGFLLRDTRVYCHALTRLLCSQTLPVDYHAWLDDFAAAVTSLQEQLAGRLDLAPVHEGVMCIRTALPGVPSDKLVIALSRALVPLDFTAGDRFVHDPALAAAPYQVLNPIRALAASPPDTDAARFAAVSARQALNRVVWMLEGAAASLGAGGAA
ncbi:M28 family peptidase [Frigidibacter mobilis]|uniref:Peptidase M28 n=1 Tax=Frigidibacter mobilis TaxID=1335048 RepID=A0A161GLX6_9RHOB|nr:M28 family peptidase [Frigidibacter mobilis]AMY68873.1 peptidase M28 [Frigidibacter mobilis]